MPWSNERLANVDSEKTAGHLLKRVVGMYQPMQFGRNRGIKYIGHGWPNFPLFLYSNPRFPTKKYPIALILILLLSLRQSYTCFIRSSVYSKKMAKKQRNIWPITSTKRSTNLWFSATICDLSSVEHRGHFNISSGRGRKMSSSRPAS